VAAQAASTPAGSPPAPLPGWVRAAGGLLIGVGAAEAAVLEVCYVPLRSGRLVLPVSVLAALVLNAVLPGLMYAATGSRAATVLPVGLWLLVVVALSLGRPEGDVLLPGNWQGLLLLFGGAAAAAYGVARGTPPGRATPRRPPPSGPLPAAPPPP
jgi:hypothetical protein